MRKEQGNEIGNPGRRKILKWAAGGLGLAAGAEVIRRAVKSGDQKLPGAGDSRLTDSQLADRQMREMALEEAEFSQAQKAFVQKFGFATTLEIPDRMRKSRASGSYQETGTVSNEWIYFVKHATSLLQAVIKGEDYEFLKSIGAKNWQIPANHTPNTEERDRIYSALNSAKQEKNRDQQKLWLRTIGFEF